MSNPVRYRVRHETTYHYGGNVAHSHQLLHLAPRDFAAQICLSRLITLDPEPSSRRDDVDAFGNFVTVHHREANVHHHNVRKFPPGRLEAASARVGRDDLMPFKG